MRWRPPVLARLAGVLVLTLLAGAAEAGERAGFTVGARVVRTVRVSVAASERAGRVHLEARAERGGRRVAGVSVAPRGTSHGTRVREAPIVAAVASRGGGALVVTVLPDGSPTSISVSPTSAREPFVRSSTSGACVRTGPAHAHAAHIGVPRAWAT